MDIIKDKKDNLVVASSGGVYIFNAALKLIFRHDAYVPEDIGKKRLLFASSLIPLSEQSVLVYGNFDSIYVLNVEQKTLLNINKVKGNYLDLLKPWSSNGSFAITSNKHGQLFVMKSYNADSIFILDLEKQKHVASAVPFSSNNWISNMHLVNDSLLIFSASTPSGIYFSKFNRQTLTVTAINRSLPNLYCAEILTDNDKRMWMATYNGIFKQSFTKASFNNVFTAADSTMSRLDITGIVHYQQHYFINQYLKGILVYDDSLHFIRTISFEQAGKLNFPWDITYYAKDTLLVANGIGPMLLNTVDYSLKKFWQPGMPGTIDSNALICSFIDSHHQLWMGIGSGNGVFKMDMQTHAYKYFSPKIINAQFKLRYPVNIAEDKDGNIWMAGAEGFTRYSQQKQIFDTLITELPGVGSIFGNWSYFTLDKQNNIWTIQKGKTLVKWNLNNQKFSYFKLPIIPPLTTNTVKGPWNNRLWIETDKGLLSFNILSEQFALIKKSDGLYNDDISGNIYFDSLSNRLFVGFNNAFTWFHPQDVLQERKPVTTIITEIKKINDSLSLAGDSPVNFSYKNNSFTIDFTGINYDDGENNTYAYRLFEDKPGAFTNIGQQKTVTFASLKPGNYTFQVKTILPDGTESLQPTSLPIIIAFPFYETWWFYILCFVFVVSGLYSLYRYRINHLLQLQKVRNNISADLHDDIRCKANQH